MAEPTLSPRVEIIDEPLTYHRHGKYSYYQDFLIREFGRAPDKEMQRGAESRLNQHGNEMRTLAAERARRAAMPGATYEYRAEPNTAQSQGGYFAPPAWLIQEFATGKHAERVLADLIKARGGWFDLPQGVSSINLPIIGGGGTVVQPGAENAAVPDKAITDSAGQLHRCQP